MSAKKIKVFLLVGALVLFVLLFIAPKITPKESDEKSPVSMSNSTVNSTDVTLQVYLNLAIKSLSLKEKKTYDSLIALKRLDSVAILWNKIKRPDLAAYFLEEEAKKFNTPELWFNAANRYYYSVPFVQDKTEEPILYQCAMRCFQNGLKLDPKNGDAKIMLASCYVESGTNPMEGITQLKEIEKTDSNNVKLQLTFAFFSVKSGQLDKAIKRFNKVLEIDPEYLEAYLHLADIYEQLEDKAKTIEVLEKYASKTTDVTARLEVNKYIDQLKQK